MTNPISVLLIVGSAVIGPIDSKETRSYHAIEPQAFCRYIGPTFGRTIDLKGDDYYGVLYLRPVFEGYSVHHELSYLPHVAGDHAPPEPVAPCLPPEYESFPQLCERAMREIGAVPRIEIPSGKISRWELIVSDAESQRDWPIVRCVPTPTGYRK